MERIHSYSDGSHLYNMSAMALSRIPIWKGNRNIDLQHVANIKEAIHGKATLLDSGYKIIQYEEKDENEHMIKKSYLIDGQHRICIVNDYFNHVPSPDDFRVTVTEICVNSEIDAIRYFNQINNVKPIQYEEDPNLMVNTYIQILLSLFPAHLKLFRHCRTCRPYLFIDVCRDKFHMKYDELKKIPLELFQEKCIKKNQQLIHDIEYKIAQNMDIKSHPLYRKIIDLQFGFGVDNHMEWIDDVIASCQ